MGNTFRQSLPVLLSGDHPALDATERNMAWVLMGLVSAYAASNDSKLLEAAKAVVDRAIAWSERSPSGAFEHDVNLPDPYECEDGPAGASPFMTSLLVDGLMDYYELTKDARIPKTVLKVARWYRTQALTSDGKAFRYLWGCRSDPYDDSYVSDLNVLIVHVFGAAYRFSGDGSWLDFADALADEGIDTMKVDKPKQWNQATRSFSKYLGYRATGRQP
jgi:uncharacterized protein YyaL (SSP411 family)